MQGNFAPIKDIVKPSKDNSRRPSEFSYAHRRLIKAVWYPSNENTELRWENATGKKKGTQKKQIHARLPAQVPSSNAAKISRWHRKAGAWKTQCQGEKTRKMPYRGTRCTPRVNGSMQILDTWSMTFTCPSSTTSINSSTTSTISSRSCCRVKWKEVKTVPQAMVPKWSITVFQGTPGKRT